MSIKRGVEATDSTILDKPTLRAEMRQLRQTALTVDERATASGAICARLLTLVEKLHPDRSAVLAVYLATGTEPNLDAFAVALIDLGYRVVAPVSGPIPFYTLRSVSPEMPRGAWGVREPEPSHGGRHYRAEEVSLVVTPGLAFDARGGRLGYGGGWYDRVLAGVPLVIGVCFDCQVVAEVLREPHDQRVALVVTERRVIETAAGYRG